MFTRFTLTVQTFSVMYIFQSIFFLCFHGTKETSYFFIIFSLTTSSFITFILISPENHDEKRKTHSIKYFNKPKYDKWFSTFLNSVNVFSLSIPFILLFHWLFHFLSLTHSLARSLARAIVYCFILPMTNINLENIYIYKKNTHSSSNVIL